MKDNIDIFPNALPNILKQTQQTGFDQLSDPQLGPLLSTLSASKPGGRFLELGTGSGLSTAWLLQGMDADSTLISVDQDEQLVAIAKEHLDSDSRVTFIVGKGEELILDTKPESIDFIFADTWPGKYTHLQQTLSLLNDGGLYIVDDMLPRDSWPEGHADKAANLVNYLEDRNDIALTKLCWASGIIICTKVFTK